MILSMIPWYLIAKSVHIIAVVAWFAGLFYWVRIFIYHVEAEERPENEREVLTKQFALMEQRVYKIIANPAMIISIIAGFVMLYLNPGLFKMPWMHIKLTFVFFLIGYHHVCLGIMKKLAKGTKKYTSGKLRIINEVATLFLVIIVVFAVMKGSANIGYVFLSIVVLALLMFLGIKAYKKTRLKEEGKA